MREPEALSEFKRGLTILRNQYPEKAIAHLSRAVELDKTNPFYLSYLGLAMGLAQQGWDAAEQACSRALQMKRTQPELYLNLAEVYRMAGKKAEAIGALEKGLKFTKQDPHLAKAFRRFGARRSPVVPFLDRGHFLNRHLGKVRHRLFSSVGKG
jgi:tetratricopeptide (TPR) repeat protein